MPNLNYILSKNACRYVSNQIQYSTNLLSKSERKSIVGKEALRKMDKMRAIDIAFPEFSLGWIKKIAELAKKFGVGNCCEKACVAFCYLLDHAPAGVSIEFFNNPFQDHCFVVLGRTNGEYFDISSWNKNAVICDPWAKYHSYSIVNINKGELLERTLSTTVLAKANKVTNVILIKQPNLVLRQRIVSGNKIDIVSNYRWNEEVPMIYEIWDYPLKQDIKKHKSDLILKDAIKELLTFSIFQKDLGERNSEGLPTKKLSELILSHLSPNNK